jgi:predicted phage-related endonuclease
MTIASVEAIIHKPASWHAERGKGVGSSDAGKIMAGEWFDLWEEKTGRREPKDLIDVIPVLMGKVTEDLNGWIYQRRCGVTLIAGRRVQHPDFEFMSAETDFEVEETGPPPDIVECKHVHQFSKPETVVSRYYHQCQHQMSCAGANHVYLSVIFGTTTWERFEIERDNEAIDLLEARCGEFWAHVIDDTPPPDMPAEPVEIALDDMRVEDMTGNNTWANSAVGWLETNEAFGAHKAHEKELKGLIEADVKHAHGHGLQVNRAKNGALRIKEMKNDA